MYVLQKTAGDALSYYGITDGYIYSRGLGSEMMN
jgi:hypothetical protein